MTTQTESLKLALEALEDINSLLTTMTGASFTKLEYAANAIKEALAQPEQEPLCTAAMFDDAFLAKSGLSPDTKLYTTPPQRKPLTDEQIHAIYDEVARQEPYMGAVTRRNVVRAIEAAHGIKEKNT